MKALVLRVLLLLAFINETHATDFTLRTNDTRIAEWPRLIYDVSVINLCRGVFQFEFKTFMKTAVVLYQDDGGENDFFAINLKDGQLHVMATFEISEKWHTNYTTPLNIFSDFEWHTVRIRLNCPNGPCVQVSIDGEKTYEKPDRERCKMTKNLQIGGFTSERLRYTNSISYRSYEAYYNFGRRPKQLRRGFFNACVRNIRYGETEEDMKEISNKYIEKYSVTNGCSLNYCHKPVPICKNHGKCTPSGKKQVTCNCLWTGYEGKYCDKEALELTLDGTYKVVHHLSMHSAFENEEYAFRIKTFQENAVLFYARGPSNFADMTLIEIQQSRLKMVLNPGGNRGGVNRTVISEQKISDGKWHFVQYTKGKRYYTLKVDAETKRSGKFGDYYKMDYGKDSYLGEISKQPYKDEIKIQDFIWNTGTGINRNFVTGLFKIYRNINEGFRVVPDEVLPKFNRALPSYTPKPMPETHSSPKPHCPEGKGSSTSKPTTVTALTRTYESSIRGSRVPYDFTLPTFKTKLPSSTSRPIDSNTYLPLKPRCSKGRCTTKEALELTLDGTYKVVNHRFFDSSFENEQYAFRVKTFQENAVLFYAKGPPHFADLTLIEIEQSRLKVVLNVGGGRGGINYTVTSRQNISDGKWHFVQYAKRKRYYTLKVDAETKRSGKFGAYYKMDYGKDSYLGEISKQPYKDEIKIQDFIWEAGSKPKTNFVTGLYNKLRGYKGAFRVLPVDVLPRFSRTLPASSTSKPTTIMPSSTTKPINSNTYLPLKARCSKGSCATKDALELILDGTYLVTCDFDSGGNARESGENTREKYSFRIKTLQENAFLFLAMGTRTFAGVNNVLIVQIESSRLKMTLNIGHLVYGINYSVISSQNISDGKWHFVEYANEMKYYTMKVDNTTKRSESFSEFFKTSNDTFIYLMLGVTSKIPYKHVIRVEDFIWENDMRSFNFITDLYNGVNDVSKFFHVIPNAVLPKFNKKLPSSA